MDTFVHYLPYILGAAIAVLVLVCHFSGDGGRKGIEPWRPKQRYRRSSGGLPHTGRTPVKPA